MKIPHRFSLCIALALALLAWFALRRSARAADSPGAHTAGTIEIVDGKISGQTEKGKPMRATLSNVVELLTRRYPDVSITMVGVEDLVIDNIKVQLPPRQTAIHVVLAALGEASGRKFRAQRFDNSDLLLVPDPQGGPPRTAEVFNLSPLFPGMKIGELDRRLSDAETELNYLRSKLGDQHQEVVGMKSRVQILMSQRASAEQPPKDALKRVEQIKETVTLTLQMLKSAEKSPEFQFHPGANLLVVAGGADAIDVTRKVVAALEKGVN